MKEVNIQALWIPKAWWKKNQMQFHTIVPFALFGYLEIATWLSF